ncbi:hypothetical protein DPMN_188547 [Dreissena polymorpha]|uniref:Uncharacterized protein n=1 Tax=Dreissena polymorpha TaxID=45954 RepID=A0A9D4I8L6_DREPO|nr:hypothetical protein DPMN_188547 [Dreissena polymorpha]
MHTVDNTSLSGRFKTGVTMHTKPRAWNQFLQKHRHAEATRSTPGKPASTPNLEHGMYSCNITVTQKLLDLHQENPPCTPNLEHGIYSCNITVTQKLLDLHQENPPCTPDLEHGIYSCNITVTQKLLDLHQENPPCTPDLEHGIYS